MGLYTSLGVFFLSFWFSFFIYCDFCFQRNAIKNSLKITEQFSTGSRVDLKRTINLMRSFRTGQTIGEDNSSFM